MSEPAPLAFQPPRKAAMRDIEALHALIHHWARADLMLEKSRATLYTTIRDYSVIETPAGDLAACAGLHVLWHDLAEVRSLAVQPQYQRLGLARNLLEAMTRDARDLGVTRLFAWTLTPEVFTGLGYRQISLEALPPKVWREYHKAAMLKDLA